MTTAEIIQWDVRSWAPAMNFWMSNRLHYPGYVLELGAREGAISAWLARYGAYVICSDLHAPKLPGVMCQAINAMDIPYQDEFDVIVFKSMLGACEDQARVIHEIHKALKRGGELWFAENVEGSPLHRLFRRLNPWAKHWNYPNMYELLGMMCFFEVEYKTTGFLAAFGRTEWQRDWLARLDEALFNRIVPESWHYIMFGVARKP